VTTGATGVGVTAGSGVTGAGVVLLTGVALGMTAGVVGLVLGAAAAVDGFAAAAGALVDVTGMVLEGISGAAATVSRGSITVAAFGPGTVMLARLESVAAAEVSFAPIPSHEARSTARAPSASADETAARVFTWFSPYI
jgi:hypothetical protein